MCFFFCLFEFKPGSANHHINTMIDKVFEKIQQRQDLGLSVDNRQHISTKGTLHGSMFEKICQYGIRIFIPLQLYHNPHTFTIGLIAQILNPFKSLFLYMFCDLLNQPGLINHIRQFCNDQCFPGAVRDRLHLGPGPHSDNAATGFICAQNPFIPQN